MTGERDLNPYFAKALDSYRLAIKALGRDTLIVISILVLFGLLTVIPFVQWRVKEAAINRELADQLKEQAQIDTVTAAIRRIKDAVDFEMQALEIDGNDLAARLSRRLSDFAIMVNQQRNNAMIALRDDMPFLPGGELGTRSTFPGANIAEQMAFPTELPGSPRPNLPQDFNVSEEEFRSIVTADMGTAEWDSAEQVVKRVFHSEVRETYKELNRLREQAYNHLDALSDTVFAVLSSLNLPLAHVELPGQLSFKPLPPPIVPPTDDEMFRTRQGKIAAMMSHTEEIGVDLESTLQPLSKTESSLASAGRAVAKTIAKLRVQREEAQDRLKKLEDQIKDVEQQMAALSVPFKWLPFDAESVVRIFPAVVASLFLMIAYRFKRLKQLRSKVDNELRELGRSAEDIELALSVPESSVDLVSLYENREGQNMFLLLVPLAAICGATLLLLWRVETSPASSGWLLTLVNILLVSLMLYSFGSYFKKWLFK